MQTCLQEVACQIKLCEVQVIAAFLWQSLTRRPCFIMTHRRRLFLSRIIQRFFSRLLCLAARLLVGSLACSTPRSLASISFVDYGNSCQFIPCESFDRRPQRSVEIFFLHFQSKIHLFIILISWRSFQSLLEWSTYIHIKWSLEYLWNYIESKVFTVFDWCTSFRV